MFFDVYQYIYIGDIMFFKKIDSRIKIEQTQIAPIVCKILGIEKSDDMEVCKY